MNSLWKLFLWLTWPLRWLWGRWKALWKVVKPTRFAALLIIAGGVLLVFSDQGRELSLHLVEGGFADAVLFTVGVTLWAFSSWLWSRAALNLIFGSDRRSWDKPQLIKVLPRAYALLVFGLAGISLLFSGAGLSSALVLLAGAALVLVFVWLRVPILEKLVPRPTDAQASGTAMALYGLEKAGESRIRELSPALRVCLAGSLAIVVLIGVAFAFYPVEIGSSIGAATVAFLGFACLLPVGSMATALTRDAGFPIVLALVAWAVVGTAFADKHIVRIWESNGEDDSAGKDGWKDPRPPLRHGAAWDCDLSTADDPILDWFCANDEPVHPDGTRTLPIVFVSTAGGGLRAAYWTASVLGELQGRDPCFATKLFSISGVSGGSLGAVTFNSWLSAYQEVTANACDGKKEAGFKVKKAAQKGLEHDFLGPTLAGLLFPDLMDNFLPLPFPTDRAAALEIAWEAGWELACREVDPPVSCARNPLARPFLELWDEAQTKRRAWLPALFLNGTHQETGKRILTSNIKVQRTEFSDAFDFYHLTKSEIRASTAALNSARFPYVTPSGYLAEGDTARGHILDGGYFENYGAETTLELARAVLSRLAQVKEGYRIRPIFIEILSDPDLSGADLERMSGQAANPECTAPCPGRPMGTGECFLTFDESHPKYPSIRTFGNEFLAPIDGVANAREARGILAAKHLDRFPLLPHKGSDRFEKPVFAQFSLSSLDRRVRKPALGWILAGSTFREINLLSTLSDNGAKEPCDTSPKGELRKVLKALRVDP